MSEAATSRTARWAFRWLNRLMLGMWRIGWGRLINFWPAAIGRIMLITHTGRHSGREYQTPVNYSRIDDQVYCLAGFGRASDWYRNLKAHPQVKLRLPDGVYQALAEEVPIDPASLRLVRQVLIDSGFAAPLFGGIRPRSIGDDALLAAVADYRLMRFQPVAGTGG